MHKQYACCVRHYQTVLCFATCVAVHMCCVCMGVYVSVVFKNGKGSFTQCILIHMHKGCVNPASRCILCELTIVWAKRN